jgi:hypothetical protein
LKPGAAESRYKECELLVATKAGDAVTHAAFDNSVGQFDRDVEVVRTSRYIFDERKKGTLEVGKFAEAFSSRGVVPTSLENAFTGI